MHRLGICGISNTKKLISPLINVPHPAASTYCLCWTAVVGKNSLSKTNICIYTRVGPKVSGLTYKSRAKWKMLRGIYSDIYGETIFEKQQIYIYIYILKNSKVVFYFCRIKKLVRPENFGPTLVCMYVCMYVCV